MVTEVLPPKQAMGAYDALAANAVGCVTVILVVAVQPFASDTVKV